MTHYLSITQRHCRYDFDIILIDICDSEEAALKAIDSFKDGLHVCDRKSYTDFKVVKKEQGHIEILHEFLY